MKDEIAEKPRTKRIYKARDKQNSRSKHPLYWRWSGMLRRCHDPTDHYYYRYGARGIYVCERWQKSFWDFAADMGMPESMDLQVERIDNNGPYSPDNCRWATVDEQRRNTRRTKWITVGGKATTLIEAARQYGIPRNIVFGRLKLGWDVLKALTTPPLRRGRTV